MCRKVLKNMEKTLKISNIITRFKKRNTAKSPFEIITKENKYTKKEAKELRKKALYIKKFKD